MSFREATKDDLQLLYEWANDAETRKNSFTQNTITMSEHIEWYNTKLADVNSSMLIYLVEDSNVGLCRIEKSRTIAVLSYSIALQFRGKGYGKKMLIEIEKLLLDKGITTIIAKVKAQNIASIKIFDALEYTRNCENKTEIEFKKVIK